jgi:hypothetical protein
MVAGSCGWAEAVAATKAKRSGNGALFLAVRCPWVKHSGDVIRIQETLNKDSNDIVEFNGRVGWVQTELDQVVGGDRHYYSFWVHKSWRIEKTSMIEDSGFKSRRRAYRIL